MSDQEQEEQEGTPISVLDKAHPALGATEEEQDVSQLNRIIVPVGAYTDPNNPDAASASVNLTLDKSPVAHDASYGQSDLEDAGVEADEVMTPMDATGEGGAVAEEQSENRDEWTKDAWQNLATSYGLPTSGNKDEVIARVEEYEAENPPDENA